MDAKEKEAYNELVKHTQKILDLINKKEENVKNIFLAYLVIVTLIFSIEFSINTFQYKLYSSLLIIIFSSMMIYFFRIFHNSSSIDIQIIGEYGKAGEEKESGEKKKNEIQMYSLGMAQNKYNSSLKSIGIFKSLFKSLFILWVFKIFIINIINIPTIILPLNLIIISLDADLLLFIIGFITVLINVIYTIKYKKYPELKFLDI